MSNLPCLSECGTCDGCCGPELPPDAPVWKVPIASSLPSLSHVDDCGGCALCPNDEPRDLLPAEPPSAGREAMARAMHKRFRDGNKTKLIMCPIWEDLTPIAQGDWLDYARAAYEALRAMVNDTRGGK